MERRLSSLWDRSARAVVLPAFVCRLVIVGGVADTSRFFVPSHQLFLRALIYIYTILGQPRQTSITPLSLEAVDAQAESQSSYPTEATIVDSVLGTKQLPTQTIHRIRLRSFLARPTTKTKYFTMGDLEDAVQLIIDRTPNLAIEQLPWLSKEIEGIHKKVKSRLHEIHKSPSQPSQSGLQAVTQYLDKSYPKIEAIIEEGFPKALEVKNILAHDIAGAHRTPIAKARGALASLYLASAHNRCDEIGKAEGKIPETRLETLLASEPGSTSFKGTVKYFIRVNSLDHIAHVSHSLSKVGYRLLYLLRCLRLDEDLLGLLLFCVGPLSRVKFGQLEELPKLLEKYRGSANKNQGWLGRWLASYRGILS